MTKIGLTMPTITILIKENITVDTLKYLSDGDIDKMGISCIGDKCLIKKLRG